MNSSLTISEVVLRLAAATIAGALVGIERESHGRAAGLRTTILACVASALSMIVSEGLFVESISDSPNASWRPDPARLGAGILTGIGFLGAGTILRNQNVIRGVTTAASLWFVTVLGLAFGSGMFFIGAIGVAIAIITLIGLPMFERFIPADWYATVTVTMSIDGMTEEQFKERMRALGVVVKRLELNYDLPAAQKTISGELKLQAQQSLDFPGKIITDLRSCPGVTQIKWM